MIKVKTFIFNPFQVNTYVLINENNEGIIIDAAMYSEKEFQEITDYLEKENIRISHLLNTHCHVDHLLGVSKIQKHFQVPFLANEKEELLLQIAEAHARSYGFELDSVPVVDQFLNDGDVFKFGNQELKLIMCPGHSPGSIAFYSEEGGFVIVGDVLFNGSIGRTDLPGGNFETLINSIKKKLFSLPDKTRVLCGHGPETTILDEKNHNPYF